MGSPAGPRPEALGSDLECPGTHSSPSMEGSLTVSLTFSVSGARGDPHECPLLLACRVPALVLLVTQGSSGGGRQDSLTSRTLGVTLPAGRQRQPWHYAECPLQCQPAAAGWPLASAEGKRDPEACGGLGSPCSKQGLSGPPVICPGRAAASVPTTQRCEGRPTEASWTEGRPHALRRELGAL